MNEQSKPIGDAPRPPFLILKRALEETFYEIKRHLAEKRDGGAPLPAQEALAEVRHSFSVVFRANRDRFPQNRIVALAELQSRIDSAIFTVEQLMQSDAIAWLKSTRHDELFALEHLKINLLDAILAEAQSRLM